MTEEDVFAATGERKHTGKANPVARNGPTT